MNSLANAELPLYFLLERAAALYESNIVFEWRSQEQTIYHVSYSHLFSDVCLLAGHLSKLRLQGEVILVDAVNTYESLVSVFAACTMGAIAAPMNFNVTSDEFEMLLKTLSPSLVVCSEDNIQFVKSFMKGNEISILPYTGTLQLSVNQIISGNDSLPMRFDVSSDLDRPALAFMTSGSVGMPKIVLLPQHSLCPRVEFEPQKYLSMLPLYHVAGLMPIVNAIAVGTTVCISDTRKYLADISWFRPVSMQTIPSVISALVRYHMRGKIDLSSIKYVCSCGAPPNIKAMDYLERIGISCTSGYGNTETSGPVAEIRGGCRKGSIGRPAKWNEVKIAKNGELLIKGQNLMLKYYKNPVATDTVLEAGWFHTGDIAYKDKDGFLYITGRLKNVIILSNGENINPEAVESVLLKCSDVEEVVVYSKNDKLVASVWSGSLCNSQSWDRIKKYVAEYNRDVPTYRKIRGLALLRFPLPKTQNGKIQRRLAAEIESQDATIFKEDNI